MEEWYIPRQNKDLLMAVLQTATEMLLGGQHGLGQLKLTVVRKFQIMHSTPARKSLILKIS